MLNKVGTVFRWAIGVLLLYGGIAVFSYGFYVLFWGDALLRVYFDELPQMFSFAPGLVWMILSVTMVFLSKAILTRKGEIEAELNDQRLKKEKETLIKEKLKVKLASYHANEKREKSWVDRFNDKDPEINFETIDFLLDLKSGQQANSFEEDESKFEINAIDLSLDQLSMEHPNGFDEEDTDLDLAPADQTHEYMSPYPKSNPDKDDTDLDYPKEG